MSVNIYSNSSFADIPLGLKLQQTLLNPGTNSVIIPSNIKRVYAVCIGGGGGGGTSPIRQDRRITAISGDGTTVTYTCANNYVAGMQVTVTGSSITGYNVTNATIATASSTQFTVTNATTGTPTLTNALAIAQTVTTGAVAGGTITAVTAGSPTTGQVTYSSTAIVPVGVPVTIAGATPTGYNGTFVVVASTPGTSFTVNNATTGAATGTITFTGVVRYTCANNYSIGSLVTMTGHTATGFNLSNQVVVDASSTAFSVANTLAQATTWTSGGNSQFSGNGAGAGGGGAGAFSAGWTNASNTCIVGAGGDGGQMGLSFGTKSTTFNINNTNGNGFPGGFTQYGQVIAGGGGGGQGCHPVNTYITPTMGGAGGGAAGMIGGGQAAGATSYTGAPGGSAGSGIGYAGGGGSVNGNPSGNAGGAGVSGAGGGGNNATSNSNQTGGAGGQGLIGGGGASAISLLVATGGTGGAGDKFSGGSGSTGTGLLFGAGGGGAGYLASGFIGSANTGGAGGQGGGGGGAGCNSSPGGKGGDGAIFIYY